MECTAIVRSMLSRAVRMRSVGHPYITRDADKAHGESSATMREQAARVLTVIWAVSRPE